MKIYKDIEVKYNADVLIIGGGPAGVCAAISAARFGASTVLVEEGGFCGGMATRGLVGPFMTCYDAEGKEMIIRGLFEEIKQQRPVSFFPAQQRKSPRLRRLLL